MPTAMWNKDAPRFRSCDPDGAPPGWCLRNVARCQGLPDQVFDRPKHSYTSIEYIESGFGTLSIAGQESRLGAGDAFILPQGVDHRIMCDAIHPWRVLFIDCYGPLPEQLRVAYGLEKTCIFPGAAISQPIRNLLNFVGDDAELQIRTGQVIHEILAKLYANVTKAPDWPEIVIRAKAFIDANLESSIRLADIAAHAGCSEAHLSRNFRRCIGSPPVDYLITRRMDLAKALLDTTGEPIKAIAERLGYRDTFAFSHAFKTAVGASPSQWRSSQVSI
jgi:AraC-like DNA-binding protein